MGEIVDAARGGMPVLGICNGFQILCESHLLPGALIRNDHRKFGCLDQRITIENDSTRWTSAYATGQELTIVLKNGEGPHLAGEHPPAMLGAEGRGVARDTPAHPHPPPRAPPP